MRVWEANFSDKFLKESHTSLVSVKTEKEYRFHDHAWIT